MTYNKATLETELSKLTGKQIAEIYYYDRYEFFESFTQLNAQMQCVLLKGILLKTAGGLFFNIQDTDYYPDLSLGGMYAVEVQNPVNPPDRKNHINGKQWLKYKDSEITAFRVHEIKHATAAETYTVPLGISLDFKNGETLHIYNAFVEDYNGSTRRYELSRGESLTFFFDTKTLQSYPELADGLVVEVEDFE